MLVFLLGMPGTGKSSIGKNVVKMLGSTFIDLDKLIEKKQRTTISEIWKKNGEEYFRKLESETLKEISISENAIVSCGGGTPCFYNNLNWMNENGITVYLELPLNVLAQRIFEKKNSRPIFSQLNSLVEIEIKLNEIYIIRKEFYESANSCVKLRGTFPNDFYLVKEKVLQYLK